jgi:hypothetical protein
MQCSETDGGVGFSHYNEVLVINCTHSITVMLYVFDILDQISCRYITADQFNYESLFDLLLTKFKPVVPFKGKKVICNLPSISYNALYLKLSSLISSPSHIHNSIIFT